MIYTVSCLICTTLLGALFKWSEAFKARAAAIIPINYFVCFAIGVLHSGVSIIQEFSRSWLPYSIGLGCLFILGFRYFAKTIELSGLPTATLFQKMSIILTVLLAVLMGDSLNYYQFSGLLLGLASIYLILDLNSSITKVKINNIGFLLVALIISSCIEIMFIFVEKSFSFNSQLKLIFPSYIFLIAGILGFISLYIMYKKISFTLSELSFGLLLGIPNFYSIYFLMMALHHELSGSVFFPVLNCSVIALSCIIGKFIFNEKLNNIKLSGIVLSILSTFLIFYFKK